MTDKGALRLALAIEKAASWLTGGLVAAACILFAAILGGSP